MTVVLDPLIAVGQTRVAALSRISCGGSPLSGALIFWGRKTPVAVLIADAQGVRGVGVDGEALSGADLEALCPGALDQFNQACQAAGPDP